MQPSLALTGGAGARATRPDSVSAKPTYELAPDEIIVDSFAGAGGMSCAITWATGRAPDVAINHDPVAIATHEANHPQTQHYSASVYALDPREVVAGRPVGLMHASPDCRSHSRARGSAPKSKSVRDLAWVVVHWAELVSPRMISLENVIEFTKWTELGEDGQPIPGTEGETFRKWVKRLERLGYAVEWKNLNAADYGAPTTRIRLFIQARRDGLPILWPVPTHGAPDHPLVQAGVLQPWRTAAECIEYERPTHSIFLSAEEAKAAGCKRPLAEKTMRRIAKGMFRHVINNPEPFLLNYQKPAGNDHPFGRAANENPFGVVVPLTHQGDDRSHSAHKPLPTVTAANRGELAWVAPYFARTAHGDVCAKGKKRGKGDHGPQEPYPTVTSSRDSALVVPTLIQTGYGERKGQSPRSLDLNKPLGTAVAGGSKHAVVAAHLTCASSTDTLPNAMAGTARRIHVYADVEEAVDRSQQVADFLWKYRDLSDVPITRNEVGTIHIGGVPLRISDIGLRMLAGTELARAQGFDLDEFDPTVRIERTKTGEVKFIKNTATSVVKMVGNSVSPPVGCAVIRAMLGHGAREPELRAAA